jgi:hypothetical protein
MIVLLTTEASVFRYLGWDLNPLETCAAVRTSAALRAAFTQHAAADKFPAGEQALGSAYLQPCPNVGDAHNPQG